MAGINPRNASTTAPQGQSVGKNGSGWGINLLNRNRGGTIGSWEPTVVYLLLLVILEVIAFGSLRYAFRSVHGG